MYTVHLGQARACALYDRAAGSAGVLIEAGNGGGDQLVVLGP
jgi:hypothetical protein